MGEQAKKINIALINPRRPDGLVRTILDGLLDLIKCGENLDFRLSGPFDYDLPLSNRVLSRADFLTYAAHAEVILLCWGKDGTDIDLAKAIARPDRTFFIDGSEPGKNRRLDPAVTAALLAGDPQAPGGVDQAMLVWCRAYFRREWPYPAGVTPLPFGIETRYGREFKSEIVKDVDFCCVFGQEDYPPLRRQVRELVESFCVQNGFSCLTQKTKTPEEFYQVLARTKVGVSVSGGGFDTFRFWEILGNNCLLLTERLALYPAPATELDYRRIYQFADRAECVHQLEHLGAWLRNGYDQSELGPEYAAILARHSSAARVRTILTVAKELALI